MTGQHFIRSIRWCQTVAAHEVCSIKKPQTVLDREALSAGSKGLKQTQRMQMDNDKLPPWTANGYAAVAPSGNLLLISLFSILKGKREMWVKIMEGMGGGPV